MRTLRTCIAVIVLAAMASDAARADVRAEFINPLLTDSNMRQLTELPGASGGGINLDHYVVIDNAVPRRNALLVFLPGSGGVPADYTEITNVAAGMGFHVVAPIYPNWPTIEALQAGQADPNVGEHVHRERLYGEDATTLLTVAAADSVVNRLVKLLQYLDQSYPGEGWGTFLTSNALPRWNRMLLAGHSQGGQHASYLAREFPLGGIVYCSGPSELLSYNPPTAMAWNARPSLVPLAKQFGFVHQREPAVDGWLFVQSAFGLGQFGPVTSVDTTTPPYNGTHQLISNLHPAIPGAFHSSTAVDRMTPRLVDNSPRFAPVWRYMLDGAAPPVCPADFNGVGGVTVQDIFDFLAAYFVPDPRADFNGVGGISVQDIFDFLGAYFAC